MCGARAKGLEDWADWVRQRERSGNVSTIRLSSFNGNGKAFRISECIQRCEVTYTILPKKAPNGQRIVSEHESLAEAEIRNAIDVG